MDDDVLLGMLINTKKAKKGGNQPSEQAEFHGLVGDLVKKIEIKLLNKPELFPGFNEFKDLYLEFQDSFVDEYLEARTIPDDDTQVVGSTESSGEERI